MFLNALLLLKWLVTFPLNEPSEETLLYVFHQKTTGRPITSPGTTYEMGTVMVCAPLGVDSVVHCVLLSM